MATLFGGRWSKPLGAGPESVFSGLPVGTLGHQVGMVYHSDFLRTTDGADYVVTNITSGTADILQGGALGVLRLAATVANQGLGSVQFTGADAASEGIAVPAASRTIAFEARVICNDWSNCDWFVGLGGIDTTFMSAAGVLLTTGGDNAVGFRHLEAGNGTPIPVAAGTAVLQSFTLGSKNVPLTNGAGHRLGFRIFGTDRVQYYIDGVRVTPVQTMTAPLAASMTATYAMIANGAAITFDIDYVTVAQTR